ncbi:MAG: glycoside hydrolase family 92 protein [Bacteroidales bacterium]|nr:glycoside hydrolase family 92 protein [Bacteroidales bacterium]
MEKHKCYLLLPAILILSFISCKSGDKPADSEDLTQYVDPLIGTAHCRWFHVAPGANPFGLAKPGPSTDGHRGNLSGWEAVGYDFRHQSIEGFPNFHEFQIGGVVFMPTKGELKTVPGEIDTHGTGYRSFFDKKDEILDPGYYSVILQDYGIRAELTSTDRVSFHRYTFPAGDDSHILFDIGNKQGESGEVKDAFVRLTDDGRIEGFVETYPEYVKKYQTGASVKMFFSAVIDKAPRATGIFHGTAIQPDLKEVSGPGAGLFITFSTKDNESITIKAGLSYTSVENARLNLEAEAKELGFDEAAEKAKKNWNAYLGRIRVEGTNIADKVKFYTGLYHALLGRGLASDVNGAYPRHDGSSGMLPLDTDNKPLFNFYNTDGIWGGQWNLIQLWALAYPEYLSDYVKTHLQVYQDAGWLGDGIACSKFVSGVGTNQVPLAIVGAYQCGIRDFDIQKGYEASLKNEITSENRVFGAGKMDVGKFVKYGFVPYMATGEGVDELWKFSCSHTLEYSFTSYAVAQMAKALGREDDYKMLMQLAGGWEKIFHPQRKMMWPKLENGEFLETFDATIPHDGFQEGNAFQYSFYVPHDPEGIVSRIGQDEFNSRLDSTFIISKKDIFGGGTEIHAFAGITKPYNHGNQPCLHTSWLFNHSGKPSKTQMWVRAILNEFYGTEGIHGYGYGQDEDQGQLGAWYVMSAIGLFDVKGLTEGEPRFGITSPLFDRITISLNNEYHSGSQFIIESVNNSPDNIYIHTASLNGEELGSIFVPFHSVVNGGKLSFVLGNTPKE